MLNLSNPGYVPQPPLVPALGMLATLSTAAAEAERAGLPATVHALAALRRFIAAEFKQRHGDDRLMDLT